MQEMGRLCFEIGNRHLSLKISDDNVLIPHDEPTEKHLKNLGFECENIIGRFDDFIVAKLTDTHSATPTSMGNIITTNIHTKRS